jgi:hypothetical protein
MQRGQEGRAAARRTRARAMPAHASPMRRSLIPLAGAGTMLNWELFNSWYDNDFSRYVEEGDVPDCGGCAWLLSLSHAHPRVHTGAYTQPGSCPWAHGLHPS